MRRNMGVHSTARRCRQRLSTGCHKGRRLLLPVLFPACLLTASAAADGLANTPERRV